MSDEDPRRVLAKEFGVDTSDMWRYQAEDELRRRRKEKQEYEFYKSFEAWYFEQARELGTLIARRLGL